jgi:uncharacterized protein RhaS with RHS repeats
MQTDPIGHKDGINWYAYVDGDPINNVDSDGMEIGNIRTGWEAKKKRNRPQPTTIQTTATMMTDGEPHLT